MAEETLDEFYRAAYDEFGKDKFFVGSITNVPDELKSVLTQEEVNEYKQVWLMENKCPACGSLLDGLLGSFTWDLIHGEGHCAECNKVDFRLYHYLGKEKVRVTGFSLIGF